MSNSSNNLVLVAGAGPTGLTMALALAKSGVKVRIINEATIEHDAARGTAIVPRTQELLAILGVAKDVAAVATGPLPMAVYGPDGKTILKAFEWSEPAEASPTIPFNNLASISQSEVEKILRRHLKTYGCEVELGKQLVGITQDDNSVRAKVLLVGTSTEIDIECEYLVAADGRSRHFIGVSFLGETKAADRMWTANVEVPSFSREVQSCPFLPAPLILFQYWHRWGDFAQAVTSLKPINPGSQFQMQSLGPNLPKDVPQDLVGTQKLFNSIAKRNDLVFTTVQWITEWKANIRMTDKFSVGRVFLAGDVAHCHSPAGGQGTNTAMQDAFNLAWKISLVIKGKASSDLLKYYEAERMPVVVEMLSLSNELHAKAFPHIPESTFEAGNTSTDPMMRSSKLLQLGVNYRWSSIMFDERITGERSAGKNPYGTTGDKIRAGDCAPYVGELQEESNTDTDLYTLLRNASSHLALFFPASASSFLGKLDGLIDAELLEVAVISRATMEYHPGTKGVRYFVDPQGLAANAYDVQPDRDLYVVIRPDGVIGAYAFGTEGIQEYFSLLGILN
ncbi:Pentachlorophenol 4-monooxygenase [Mycena venus]|uniref:Pentachlorophenol 4-monooxygenase n=1 Tax=Mycena venus TaxID=2733690 RepID=A0A8H6X792_9AGAR|nr:Pentachlorophenol 4-monooxygenase [Mycena venus]